MKIAAISIVKDEADIIEAFVRHTIAFVDRLYIVDDTSSDNTPLILRKLSEETSSVVVIDDNWNGAFHQSARTTKLMKIANENDAWDVIFALDADEMIAAPSRSVVEAEIATIPPGMAGGFDELPYCIHPSDNPDTIDPLVRIRHAATNSPWGIFKSFATAELLKRDELSFSEGNHRVRYKDINIESWRLQSVSLAHFAVRSFDQLIMKCKMSETYAWQSPAFNIDILVAHTVVALTK